MPLPLERHGLQARWVLGCAVAIAAVGCFAGSSVGMSEDWPAVPLKVVLQPGTSPDTCDLALSAHGVCKQYLVWLESSGPVTQPTFIFEVKFPGDVASNAIRIELIEKNKDSEITDVDSTVSEEKKHLERLESAGSSLVELKLLIEQEEWKGLKSSLEYGVPIFQLKVTPSPDAEEVTIGYSKRFTLKEE